MMAVAGIHQSSVVHHDISPSNLVLDHEKFIRVIDFGRAGYIGEGVPSHMKDIKSPANAIFSIGSNKNALKETIGIFTFIIFRFTPCPKVYDHCTNLTKMKSGSP